MRSYKRDHPRVNVRLPVELTVPGGEVIHALTVNISPAGVQIACDRVTVNSILPLNRQATGEPRREFDVRLRFPESSGMPDVIETRCAAAFSRRMAEHEYRVGLQFLGLEDDDYRKLEHFLERQYQRVGS